MCLTQRIPIFNLLRASLLKSSQVIWLHVLQVWKKKCRKFFVTIHLVTVGGRKGWIWPCVKCAGLRVNWTVDRLVQVWALTRVVLLSLCLLNTRLCFILQSIVFLVHSHAHRPWYVSSIGVGDSFDIGYADYLVLDGSRSKDPDETSEDSVHSWACFDSNNYDCFFDNERVIFDDAAIINKSVATFLETGQT